MKTKICSKCGIEQLTTEFYKNSTKADKLHSNCKTCENIVVAAWARSHPTNIKMYQDNWKVRNPDKVLAGYKRHNATQANRHWPNQYKWSKANPEKIRELQRKINKRKRATPRGALAHRISTSIQKSLKGNKAGRSWELLVGYTVNDLYKHLESKFLPGMSWENMGKWHIDHIVPESFFEYITTEDQEFQYCWSLDNLQPLWAKDNISKGNTLPIIYTHRPNLNLSAFRALV